ncbi:MAG TPA: DciA family protein [Candidatus Saccharimonadales bacterium]|jgi:hypothetical protein
MDSIKDLLKKKADLIDADGRLNDLELAQDVLRRHFKTHAKAVRIDKDKLFVQVTSSSAASDVRLNQIAVLEELGRVLKSPPAKLVIRQ